MFVQPLEALAGGEKNLKHAAVIVQAILPMMIVPTGVV
jgi:hypothetical protein